HFALTVSNFLLVIASIERYLANGPIFTKKRLLVLLVHNKVLVVSMIFVLSFLFKATLYFENATIALDHCQVIESLVPVWVTDGTTEQSVRFWLRKCFTMIVPFMILAFCNTHIVWHLRSRRRRADAEKGQQAAGVGKRKSIKATRSGSFKRRYSEKRGVRVATRTLVMVVGCYLISNTTTTIINIWEYFDVHFLRYEHYYSYLIASDIAALLTICGCALRLPIYVINDRRIRKAIFRALIRWRYYRTEELNEAEARNLEKWSIIIVSNSLRSNLTGMLSQVGDLTHFKGKKSFDQLAVVVQNRRRFLVQMTINLGQVCELPPGDDSPLGHDVTYLTDIHEEDEDAELLDQETTTIKKLTNYSAVVRPSTSAAGWKSWKANI
ncbi:Protein Y40C5A.4 a, partial [Aphelenchoides avenae]